MENVTAFFEEILTIQNILVLVIALCSAAIVGFVGYLIYRYWMQTSKESEYEDQFQSLFVSEFDSEEANKEQNSLGDKWNSYWRERTKQAGLKKYTDTDPNTPGRDAAVYTLIGAIIAGVVTLNPILAILAAGAIPLIYNIFLGLKINQIQSSINAQVPPFLAALKANIQANETPERALINVINDMGEPLYTELVPVRNRIQSGATLAESLEELKERTTSEELKFLCACIKIASLYGANLEKQIDVIQNVVAERNKIADKLAGAARSTRPAMILSAIIIPGLFFFIYMFYEAAQDFWFINPLSYLALILIILLYAASIWFTKMMVDGIKKM